ncbi:hypothetical protein PoB_005185500 [Plakobranchus ocellatus]|uniref:Uncharacterized protein n=1 Tax=Plakobranchus ocellatus TaxID=259542 RepID=A0AAV4C1S4_9GAST|nr:hypothetical protein PoB_005185500 [Plakobranchus ocellatus]
MAGLDLQNIMAHSLTLHQRIKEEKHTALFEKSEKLLKECAYHRPQRFYCQRARITGHNVSTVKERVSQATTSLLSKSAYHRPQRL